MNFSDTFTTSKLKGRIVLTALLELLIYVFTCFVDHYFTKINEKMINDLWSNKQREAYWQCDSKRDVVILLQIFLTLLSLIMAFFKNYSRSVSMILIVLLGDILLWHYVWKTTRSAVGTQN